MDTFLEVLKWTGIAFAAGFVGYFGRVPAKWLLIKIKGGRKPEPERINGEGVDGEATDLEKSRLKIEKKRAKQAAKMGKKSAKQ